MELGHTVTGLVIRTCQNILECVTSGAQTLWTIQPQLHLRSHQRSSLTKTWIIDEDCEAITSVTSSASRPDSAQRVVANVIR
jgi:hypothetical protein